MLNTENPVFGSDVTFEQSYPWVLFYDSLDTTGILSVLAYLNQLNDIGGGGLILSLGSSVAQNKNLRSDF